LRCDSVPYRSKTILTKSKTHLKSQTYAEERIIY